MTISLSKEAQAIVEAAVASGRYPTPEAAIEAGLELLAARDRTNSKLRASIQAAITRGGSYSDEEVEAAIEAELDEWEKENSKAPRAAE